MHYLDSLCIIAGPATLAVHLIAETCADALSHYWSPQYVEQQGTCYNRFLVALSAEIPTSQLP